VLNSNHETCAITFKSVIRQLPVNNLAHENLAFILIFAVIELWLI